MVFSGDGVVRAVPMMSHLRVSVRGNVKLSVLVQWFPAPRAPMGQPLLLSSLEYLAPSGPKKWAEKSPKGISSNKNEHKGRARYTAHLCAAKLDYPQSSQPPALAQLPLAATVGLQLLCRYIVAAAEIGILYELSAS